MQGVVVTELLEQAAKMDPAVYLVCIEALAPRLAALGGRGGGVLLLLARHQRALKQQRPRVERMRRRAGQAHSHGLGLCWVARAQEIVQSGDKRRVPLARLVQQRNNGSVVSVPHAARLPLREHRVELLQHALEEALDHHARELCVALGEALQRLQQLAVLDLDVWQLMKS